MTYPIPDDIRQQYGRELMRAGCTPVQTEQVLQEAWGVSCKAQLLLVAATEGMPNELHGFTHSLAATFLIHAMQEVIKQLFVASLISPNGCVGMVVTDPPAPTPPPSNGGQFK